MTDRTCDTSVLVPALAAWHRDHEVARAALADVAAIPAHVVLECYSVLTRLPSPHRWDAASAAAVLAALDVEALELHGDGHRQLVAELAHHGVRGGAVYDGLVAATVRHHGLHLVTRDRRARPVYDALGVGYTLL